MAASRRFLPAGLCGIGLLIGTCAWADAASIDEQVTLKQVTLWLDPANREIHGELRLTPAPEDATQDITLLDGLALTHTERDGDSQILHWQGRLADDDAPRGLRLSENGSFLPSHGGWYPQLTDGPFDLTLEIHLPAGQRAVATGSLAEEIDDRNGHRSRFTHPRSHSLEIATGPWQLRQRDVDGVSLRTLFPRALDDAFAETYLEHSARYLTLFQARLGDYPFESFTIAATPAPVGLAFPGFTLLGERVVPLPFIPHTSLAHELMHAWWGTGVRVDYASGNWSEALTTYLADYALDERRGTARDTRQRWLSDLAALPTERERPLAGFLGGPDPAGRLIGYQHGALVFHMLRQRIGDDAFDTGLRQLSRENMFHVTGWDDLQAAFESAADTSLADFFDAWVERPGRPLLSLEAVERHATEHGWLIEGELRQHGEHTPWPLRLALTVDTDVGQETHHIDIDQARQRFSLALGAKPTELVVDPGLDVLRQLNDAPSTLRELTLTPETRVLALTEGSETLASQLLGHPSPTPPSSAGADEPIDNALQQPLLVIGLTAAVNDWFDGQAGLADDVRELATRGAARMWRQPDTPLFVISADERRGLGHLAAALRHHGQHSYVVQDQEGTTLDTGRWQEARQLGWTFDN